MRRLACGTFLSVFCGLGCASTTPASGDVIEIPSGAASTSPDSATPTDEAPRHTKNTETHGSTPAPPSEAHPENAAAAQKLFEDARTLMQQGKIAEACPKFAESNSLDPGVGTLLNLGVCLEQVGDRAGACNAYEGARTFAKDDARRGLIDQKERALGCTP